MLHVHFSQDVFRRGAGREKEEMSAGLRFTHSLLAYEGKKVSFVSMFLNPHLFPCRHDTVQTIQKIHQWYQCIVPETKHTYISGLNMEETNKEVASPV